MKLPLLNTKKSKEAEVSGEIFGQNANPDLVSQFVNGYIENSHQGTKAQKNRSAVRGGGKKPWRQKGTGRARAGTSRSPLWRGGGVIFPASSKNAKPKKINKKMYKSAMRSIFSSLAEDKRIYIIEDLNIENPKTKEFIKLMKSINLNEGLFIIEKDEYQENLFYASRNIPNVEITTIDSLNPINLLKYNSVIISSRCLSLLEEKFS